MGGVEVGWRWGGGGVGDWHDYYLPGGMWPWIRRIRTGCTNPLHLVRFIGVVSSQVRDREGSRGHEGVAKESREMGDGRQRQRYVWRLV